MVHAIDIDFHSVDIANNKIQCLTEIELLHANTYRIRRWILISVYCIFTDINEYGVALDSGCCIHCVVVK